MSLKTSQSKHWAKKDLKIIQSYWDSPPATIRSKWFVEQLQQYEFKSIMEVGFFAGRNLRYIQAAFPQATISGIEINKTAVQFAKDKLKLKSLYHLDLHDLDSMNGVTDVVFTSGVLIHVPPEELGGAVEKIRRQASGYIMHLEQLGTNQLTAGPKHLRPTYKVSDQLQWAPDLVRVYNDLGHDDIDIIPLPDSCKTNGAAELIIVRL